MPKDGCNNMEKNAILRFHDRGQEVSKIARSLRLTERIVRNMIAHYRPDSKSEDKEIDTEMNDGSDAASEFEKVG